MRNQWIAALTVFGVYAAVAIAQEPDEPAELDTVLVVGEHPGPGLWKVSNGDHVLWVLASHGPLPKGMKWRSQEIESRIAGSQEVLYGGGVAITPNIGLLRGLTLVPAALRASKLPGRKTLADVLPPDSYARWRALRDEYLGKDKDVERLRPAIALGRLRSAAYRKAGLASGPNVYRVVGELREKHKVRRNQLPAAWRTVRFDNARALLKNAARLETPDVPCFIKAIDGLEEEIELARQRANAWARGDIATLRSLHREMSLEETLEENCSRSLMMALTEGDGADAARARKTLADMEWHVQWAGVEAEQEWLAAAEAALQKNSSTFALLPLEEVLKAEGVLAKLESRGYQVEEPG